MKMHFAQTGMRFGCAAFSLALGIGLLGCTEFLRNDIGIVEAGGGCSQTADCVAGALCQSKICTPIATNNDPARGDACTQSSDCGSALECGPQGVCAPSAGGSEGVACGLTVECASPLVCSASGSCATEGSLGTLGSSEACESVDACRKPLVCSPLTDTCEPVPFLSSASCARSDAERGAYRFYFEVPDALDEAVEFYRLPFPNNIRTQEDGSPILSDHASTGPILGLDLGNTLLQALKVDVRGFGLNAPVFFRTSKSISAEKICLDAGSSYPDESANNANTVCAQTSATLFLINIDVNSTDYGERIPVQASIGREANPYICQNWLGAGPLDGRPLAANTTYAAIVTTGLLSETNTMPIQDAHFATMLAAESPVFASEDPKTLALASAYNKMAPLRAWLAEQSEIAAEDVAAATVFTTGNPAAIADKLKAAVDAFPDAAFADDAVLCAGETISPCEDGFEGVTSLRGCKAESATFFEIQGTYTGPVYQAGIRPYRTVEDGGTMVLDANGVPSIQATEEMCYALAIPKNQPMPEGGWPTLIYAHGTGGSYRSFVSTVGEMLVDLGFAVIGFDNIVHGSRQNQPGTFDSSQWRTPDDLFFNLRNPRAARDNILQGSADLMNLVALLNKDNTGLTVSGVGSIAFSKLFFMGHSQGTVIAPPFLANQTQLEAVVLSGAGAELPLTILNKRKPIDISIAAEAFFGDQSLQRIHPLMGLLAWHFGPADAVAYGASWLAPSNGEPRSAMLHVMGLDDSFTPDVTQHALARAVGLPIVGALEEVAGIDEVSSPVANNVSGTTAGAVQFSASNASDGHFVAFGDGLSAVQLFLDTADDGTALIRR